MKDKECKSYFITARIGQIISPIVGIINLLIFLYGAAQNEIYVYTHKFWNIKINLVILLISSIVYLICCILEKYSLSLYKKRLKKRIIRRAN